MKKSTPSPKTNNPPDLNLPTPKSPLRPQSPSSISWQEFMNETATRTRLYLERHDDREKRARSRNPAEFILH
ncbi:MAG: hypothetical protein ACK5LK_08455 [Chthoniobacterales bacterium]